MNTSGNADAGYQVPPEPIQDLVMTNPGPSVAIDRTGNRMLLLERQPFISISELAEPEIRLAGLRFSPANLAPTRIASFSGMKIKNLNSLNEFPITGLPAELRAISLQWNPSQDALAFVNLSPARADLWVIDLQTASACCRNTLPLNLVTGQAFVWADDRTLIYKTLPEGSVKPQKPLAPAGPVVQESLGKKSAARTYPDLIRSTYDEALFDYYTRTQLIQNTDEKESLIGEPGLFRTFSPSPDGKYLLIQEISRPFSYVLPVNGFPQRIYVIDRDGNRVREIANNPSAEGVPIGFDDAPDFPRSFAWRNDEAATVTYVKVLDGGNGKQESEWRDALMVLQIDPNERSSEPRLLFRTRMRFQEVIWGNHDTTVFYEESYALRKLRMNWYSPSAGTTAILHERSSNDAYSDLGEPLTEANAFGRQVLLLRNKNELLLTSAGASDEGDMPLIRSFNFNTLESRILWQCRKPWYEYVVRLTTADPLCFITARESSTEITNYFRYVSGPKGLTPKALTDFTDPYTALHGVKRQKINYQRTDGVKLSGDLYLPAGYNPETDGPLPVLMWAYPMEYKSATDASQVRGSKYMFTKPFYGSPVLWVTRGYAVLDRAEMPVIGENGAEPNDTFVDQIRMNAGAAIQELKKIGVGDPERVAVGGHSYGAFMTANLLAHTNLFKAGIARSGAYNRTLTPFGFQGEERTYWEAPDTYHTMSPFHHADHIQAPLLLIHGDADNNSGTFPIQSERLYSAIKGLGGTVRFVSLPHESHAYAARENILHMLWEMDRWLETYVR
jgi:dipeptidyl aminopeptidase/acylaminoacyl peptidase